MEIWLVLAVLFLVIEFSTPGLFFGTFFAASSFITYFLSLFITVNFWYLTLTFVLLSIIFIYLLKPIIINRFKMNKIIRPANIEEFLSKDGVIIGKIDPPNKGEVEVDSERWLAVSKDSKSIEIGTIVKLEMIDGTTLVVSTK
ncbi:NfeD family protein [[Brevibacterium] frigoritolerans]|nr:NfeD family protein [Peribacillus frigoritolerans]